MIEINRCLNCYFFIKKNKLSGYCGIDTSKKAFEFPEKSVFDLCDKYEKRKGKNAN